jgi:HpcH/HpaI aldolase/citrate lyase family
VQRIGVDLERVGKAKRQRGLGTWVSTHRLRQVQSVREALTSARLFARVNPWSERSPREIETLLDLGVQVLMLPMFEGPDAVEQFSSAVSGRAEIVPLVETCSAARRVDEILAIDGVDEIHVGINDLALSLGVRNRFEVLCGAEIEWISDRAREAGVRLGIGALGRVRDTSVPIPSDLIYARLVELGAGAALIARTFAPAADAPGELAREVAASRERLDWWRAASAGRRLEAFHELRDALSRCASW